MKLPSAIFLALLWCGQAVVILSLGAQLTARSAFAVDSASPPSSSLVNSADEVRVKPDGVNQNPGWALDRIGENFSTNEALEIYSFPDTTNPVRLYLIDTAVKDRESFLAANPNLKSLDIISLSGVDPEPGDHGTQMLSLIAGKGTGIATGTPIHVINYDIYADSPTADDPTTDVTNLVEAISEAVMHSRLPDTVPMRSVICIATSSNSPASRFAINDTINAAIAAGISVVVSSGNAGADASNYTPSSNGSTSGVICVGASDGNDLKIPMSNNGDPVDILAPGLDVNTRKAGGSLLNPIVSMTGTSPATALVAGSLLTELSINGSLTPAQAENKLIASAKAASNGPPILRVTYSSIVTINNPDGPVIFPTSPISLTASPSTNLLQVMSLNASTNETLTSPAVDADSDGVSDLVEIFHKGSCEALPASPIIRPVANNKVQYRFPIAFDLFNRSNAFVLNNGYSWGIKCSSDFKNWEVPVGDLNLTTDSMGQRWLIATFPAGAHSSCFARIEIIAPSAP